MTLNFGDYSVEFRAFDNGVAYRFVTAKKGMMNVEDETFAIHFAGDYQQTYPTTATSAPVASLHGHISIPVSGSQRTKCHISPCSYAPTSSIAY